MDAFLSVARGGLNWKMDLCESSKSQMLTMMSSSPLLPRFAVGEIGYLLKVRAYCLVTKNWSIVVAYLSLKSRCF